MYRTAITKLEKWKNSKNRKPLVIYGSRQVGKTWLMREFGEKHYESVVYFSFDSDILYKKIFENDFNIVRIINELSIAAGIKISPETLIIFDEIQECPRALTSLKYFNENASEYQIITAGSLLGVISLEGTGFPVGKVDSFTMYPMSFYEFLEAIDNRFMEILKSHDFNTISTFHEIIIELLKQYFYVGGMPAAVKVYAESRDFYEMRNVQKIILDSYYADFAKHIPAATIARTRNIWNSVPTQLAKESKRFLYSDMKEGSRGRNYEAALDWLTSTNLIKLLHRVNLPNMPLIAYRQASVFKIYMNDIGLLSSLAGLIPQIYLDDNVKTFTHYKGGLTEQYVLQELLAADDSMPVFYWADEKNTSEVEFVLQYNGEIIPLEVKSGQNIKSRNLDTYRKKFQPKISVRSSLKQFGRSNDLYSIPLYLIGSIKEIIGNTV